MLLLLVCLSFVSSAQCLVTSVQFGELSECEGFNQFKIPVTITYTGTPASISVSVTGIDNDFATQEWNHFPLGNGTFIVYDVANGQAKTLTITTNLIGGNCGNLEYVETFSYTAPAACVGNLCETDLTLSGTGNSQDYQASSTIISTQIFESGIVATIGATQSVTLPVGFHAKTGSQIIINNQGCNN